MTRNMPKVRRTNNRQTVLVASLIAIALLLLGAIGFLLTSDGLFSDEPQSDAERDYQLLLEGLKKDPKNPAILMTLAEAEYELGKQADALKHAEAAVGYAKKQAVFRMRYANLLIRSNQIEQARTLVQQEIDLQTPGDPEPYFLMAQIERDRGDLKAAMKNIKRAIELEPTSSDFLVVYGEILEQSGDEKKAEQAFRTALRFIPDNQRALEGLKRLGVEPPAPIDENADPHGDASATAE